MPASRPNQPIATWQIGVFVLIQTGVMLMAISNESLWIDEFWTAHFGTLRSFRAFYDLLLVPSGSQTPLHFLHFYLWGLIAPAGEFMLRLANLPLFVAGQLALFWAVRSWPWKFSTLFLTVSALHPMVWQYANEARPYTMMYAGAQMMLASILNMHAAGAEERAVDPLSTVCFVVGGILLFGASMLGMFWVFAACVYVAWHHHRQANWRVLMRGATLPLLGVFVAVTALLTAYYLNSLLRGAGASRIASSTPATVLFAFYEVLGLSGVGPSRLALRATGLAALGPYAGWLMACAAVLLFTLAKGLQAAQERLGTRALVMVCALGLFPVVVVIASGFAMHWRVLGRHLIPALPLLNLLLALGLLSLFDTDARAGRALRWTVAVVCLAFLASSSLLLRFAERHRKDDYRAAAALAQQGVAQGQRVWWAADVVGATHYRLPGEFDFMGELTGQHKPMVCTDVPGVQAVPNASLACLRALSLPDLVILSKPETFDIQGDIGRYLQAGGYVRVQELPAFSVWKRPGHFPSGAVSLPVP
jgi:hypothetical protein